LAILASARLSMTPAAGAEAAARSGILRATEVGSAGPTPTPPRTLGLARLTDPDCCIPIGWTTDSRSLLVLARPSPESSASCCLCLSTGNIQLPGTAGSVLPDVAIEAEGTRVRLTRRGNGESWTIANDGRELRFAPGGNYVAWDIASKNIAHPDVREHALWVAEVTGAGGRRLATTIGGGLVGWAQDGQALVAAGRIESDGQEGIWSIPLDGSAPHLIHQVLRPREVLLSPAGGWVAFYAAFTEIRTERAVGHAHQWSSISRSPRSLVPLADEGHCSDSVDRRRAQSSRSIRLPGAAQLTTDAHLAAIPADWLVSPTGPEWPSRPGRTVPYGCSRCLKARLLQDPPVWASCSWAMERGLRRLSVASPTTLSRPPQTPCLPMKSALADLVGVDLERQLVGLHADGGIVSIHAAAGGRTDVAGAAKPTGLNRVQILQKGPIESDSGVIVGDIVINDAWNGIGLHSRPMDAGTCRSGLGLPPPVARRVNSARYGSPGWGCGSGFVETTACASACQIASRSSGSRAVVRML
jgi:hypothetical protein